MTTHSHKIGGSTAARIIACPASMLAPEHPMPPSPYAEEGTYLHGVMEALLRGDIDEAMLMGHPGMTEELLQNKINPALDEFDRLADDLIPPTDDWEVFLPETTYSYKGDLEGCFGTADFVGVYKRRAVILDWKFGDGVPVEAEESEQGLFYAGAVMDENPKLFAGVEEIGIVIVQPVRGRDCNYDIWWTTPTRVKEFRAKLAATLKIAEGPNPPMNTGDHCRFCRHKPLCPKVQGMVSTALLAQPNAMTADELGALANNVKTLESLCSDVMKLVQAALEEGYDVPGWKLVAKRATRKWSDEDAVEKRLKNLKVSLMDAKERPTLKSPAQIEKLLKAAKKDFSKLEDLIISESTGTTLAPASDKRPAVHALPKQLEQLAEKLKTM